MNRTRTILVATTAGIALLATACSSELTYAQAADRCAAAVDALPKGAKVEPRPKVCERLTEKDYTVIFADKTLFDAGLIDKDGHIVPTRTPSP